MYCGDETGSFIGDIGSYSCRFGYGGEDCPKYVVPSYVVGDGGGDQTVNNANYNETTASASRTTKSKRNVATSCYRYRGSSEVQYKTPLRTVQVPPEGQPISPTLDPTQFLQQGDSYNDWDAVETLWSSAFDTLHVRDRYKHTKGGGNYMLDKSTTKMTTKRQVQSTTITSAYSSNEGKCVHPILVVSPGCTHRVQQQQEVGQQVTGTEMSSSSTDEITYESVQRQHRKELVQLTELMMETFASSAMFVAPTPMLSAFSHGRQTCLVVDIGAGGCRVTPVVDGIVLKQAQRRNGRGGDWLGNVMWNALIQEKTIVRPRYQIGTSSTTTATGTSFTSRQQHSSFATFHRWAMQDLMYEFRTSGNIRFPPWTSSSSTSDTTVPFLYQTKTEADRRGGKKRKQGDTTSGTNSGSGSSSDSSSDDDDDDDDDDENDDDGNDKSDDNNNKDNAMQVDNESPSSSSSLPNKSTTASGVAGATIGGATIYELPDGTLIDLTTQLGNDLCRVPELLFSDEIPFLTSSADAASAANAILNQHPSLSNLPLHRLIRASLSAVGDVDARKDLASSILLTGGCSLLPNIEQRLSYELPRIISSAYKTKVLASKHSIERSCASWIGGSILTSLGSFQQLWLSRIEYEEYGAALAVQRFP